MEPAGAISLDFSRMSDLELVQVARQVEQFQRRSVKPAWDALGNIASYVMDIEFVIPTCDVAAEIRLIELNAFGAEFSAGSGLFHWLRDWDILYATDGVVSIRVLDPNVCCAGADLVHRAEHATPIM